MSNTLDFEVFHRSANKVQKSLLDFGGKIARNIGIGRLFWQCHTLTMALAGMILTNLDKEAYEHVADAMCGILRHIKMQKQLLESKYLDIKHETKRKTK